MVGAPFPSPSLPHMALGLHRKGNVLSYFDKLLFFGLAIIQKKKTLEITTVCVLYAKFTCLIFHFQVSLFYSGQKN